MCGLSAKVAIYCGTCNETIDGMFLCDRVGGGQSTRQPFEVNTRAVMAFRGIGCGFTAVKDWCSLMNMPHSMSKCTYTTRQTEIHATSVDITAKVMERSVCSIRSAYQDMGITEDKDGIMDIAVSFDGIEEAFLPTLELHQ